MYGDLLQREFEQLRQEIIALYDAKGMRASGRFERESKVEINEVSTFVTSATLSGPSYAEQLEYGRRGGRYPNIESIKDWILVKGVFDQAIEDIGLNSLAFLIARKISNFGWDRQQYGGVELVSSVVTPERIQKIIDKVGTIAIAEFTSSLDLKSFNNN